MERIGRRHRVFRLALIGIYTLAVNSAGANAGDSATPRPLGRDYPIVDASRDPAAPIPSAPTLTGDIELRDALAAALRGSPDLTTSAYDVRAREAAALQARVLPNPAVALEVEDFAGSGDRRGFKSSQTTLSVAQLVELGGKRSRRVQLAESEKDLATWDFETRRIAVLSDTTKAFIAVLALQQRHDLVLELESLAVKSVRSVASTVRAGAVSPVEEERATVNLERVRLEVVRSEQELQIARVLLAATWGRTQPDFARALGGLDALPPIPPLQNLLEWAPESPELARWNAEIARREAAIALQRARRVPDIILSLGARYYADDGDGGAVAGVSVPFPLFDRNRGSILETRYGLARAQSERRLVDVSVRAALTERHQTLAIALAEVEALRDRIIPRAGRLFEETMRGYATGLFRYVEVLDAQRTLFDTRRELLDALVEFHVAATDIERLTGTPLADLSGRPKP